MHAKKSTISLTHIKRKAIRKTNPLVTEAILLARKQKAWVPIAHKLSGATRQLSSVNLSEIEKNSKAGDTILVLGKVLGSGNITKKLRICSLGISKSAKEKLKETKSEAVSILEEIKKNHKAEGIKLIP